MPLYEYDCHDCGEPFEKLVRSSTRLDEIACPECGSKHIEKKISLFSSSVKGGTRSSASSAPAASCSPGGT